MGTDTLQAWKKARKAEAKASVGKPIVQEEVQFSFDKMTKAEVEAELANRGIVYVKRASKKELFELLQG